MTAPPVLSNDEGDLEWMRFLAESDQRHKTSNQQQESSWQKLGRKCTENPFVPLGLILTTAALFTGLGHYVKGNTLQQQRFMRYRVGAQGFTILALVSGMLLGLHGGKDKK